MERAISTTRSQHTWRELPQQPGLNTHGESYPNNQVSTHMERAISTTRSQHTWRELSQQPGLNTHGESYLNNQVSTLPACNVTVITNTCTIPPYPIWRQQGTFQLHEEHVILFIGYNCSGSQVAKQPPFSAPQVTQTGTRGNEITDPLH